MTFKDQLGIRGRIIVNQIVEHGSFIQIFSDDLLHFIAVNQNDIACDEFCVNV